jgi:hypothetical protein
MEFVEKEKMTMTPSTVTLGMATLEELSILLIVDNRMMVALPTYCCTHRVLSSSAFYWHSKQISGPPLCPIS